MLSEFAMCFADHNPVNWDVCVGRYTRVGGKTGSIQALSNQAKWAFEARKNWHRSSYVSLTPLSSATSKHQDQHYSTTMKR